MTNLDHVPWLLILRVLQRRPSFDPTGELKWEIRGKENRGTRVRPRDRTVRMDACGM